MRFTFTFLALAAILLGTVNCSRIDGSRIDSPAVDEVKTLPGLSESLNFKHYSGYLDSIRKSHIHYWFFESQRNPAKDPLVLWLNGGPGCSSVLGALSEHGPITLTDKGKLEVNPYAWNTQANVLYLESPAGVGFSFNDDEHYQTGDNETAELNYGALKSFLEKFPQYQANDFYVAGESYGGMYVPTLSKLVADRGYPKNFIGFALGNAYLDRQLNVDTQFYFFFHHGFIDTNTWGRLQQACCPGGSNRIDGGYCDFANPGTSRNCKQQIERLTEDVMRMPLNMYNIYGACENGQSVRQFKHPVIHPETVARTHFLFNTSGHFRSRSTLQMSVGLNPPCMNFDFMVDWLNRKEIREALHISPKAYAWSPCSEKINGNYQMQYASMHDTVKHLVDSGKRGLIYNGDIDAMCNYFGDELFTEKLGYEVVQEYRPWMYDNQIGGMVKFYKGVAFATIRGAGHTVPMDKPGQAKFMFDKFLATKGDMVDAL